VNDRRPPLAWIAALALLAAAAWLASLGRAGAEPGPFAQACYSSSRILYCDTSCCCTAGGTVS